MKDIKNMTLQGRLTFTINYIKNFAIIIVPLFSLMGYISVLIIEDSDAYKRVNNVVEWSESTSNSFAVGLRVKQEKNDDGKTIYKIIYKATNGETYPAVYSSKGHYWFYLNDKGKTKECH